MKFGQTLQDLISDEWHPHSVDYAKMKGVLKGKPDVEKNGVTKIDTSDFFKVFEQSKDRIRSFYDLQKQAAIEKLTALTNRIDALERTCENTSCNPSSSNNLDEDIAGLERHLDLLIEFLHLNKTGFSKILKKFDKNVGASVRETKLEELMTTHTFLDGGDLFDMKEQLDTLERKLTQIECGPDGPIEGDLSLQVADIVRQLQTDSKVFDKNHTARALPHFKPSEVSIGPVLGEGEFGIVKQVQQFRVTENCHICFLHNGYNRGGSSTNLQDAQESLLLVVPPPLNNDNNNEQQPRDVTISSNGDEHISVTSDISDIDELEADHNDDDVLATRGFMKDHCFRGGSARYAIKRLKDDLTGEMRVAAAADIAMEAQFLSVVSHPNIVKIRGVGGTPGRPDFFIILDRLLATLTETCGVWKKQMKKAKGFCGLRKNRVKLDALWLDRVIAAFDIARAVKYLHSKNIIFRDLKPENVGFDIRGDAKLFDFGLAKELMSRDEVTPGKFEASGITGSRRYMAPEVVLCEPYGKGIDAYSFAILLWEILTLKPAYADYDCEKHFNLVVIKDKRPKLPSAWPGLLKVLLQDAWSGDPSVRPSFTRICDLLSSEIIIKDGEHFLSNRSQELLRRSESSRWYPIQRR
mmetsp:Transcript_16953/g.28144  ORF Transcript_16953/g.28144 Transcript_16953/m.28144 type:complete len:637 (-) Transcript_16953:458-2368(-)